MVEGDRYRYADIIYERNKQQQPERNKQQQPEINKQQQPVVI